MESKHLRAFCINSLADKQYLDQIALIRKLIRAFAIRVSSDNILHVNVLENADCMVNSVDSKAT